MTYALRHHIQIMEIPCKSIQPRSLGHATWCKQYSKKAFPSHSSRELEGAGRESRWMLYSSSIHFSQCHQYNSRQFPLALTCECGKGRKISSTLITHLKEFLWEISYQYWVFGRGVQNVLFSVVDNLNTQKKAKIVRKMFILKLNGGYFWSFMNMEVHGEIFKW